VAANAEQNAEAEPAEAEQAAREAEPSEAVSVAREAESAEQKASVPSPDAADK
tara:strand:- start:1372 stop:1530 length:159 start_codon:yes stop_codon:yes gene_type:complete